MSSIICNYCEIMKDCKYYRYSIHSCHVVNCADIQHEMSRQDIENITSCRDKVEELHKKHQDNCSSVNFPDELDKINSSLSGIIDMYNTDVTELLSIVDSEHNLIKRRGSLMTDKEKLIKTFQEIGVEFEIDKDGDIKMVDKDDGCVFFIFRNDGKFIQHEI